MYDTVIRPDDKFSKSRASPEFVMVNPTFDSHVSAHEVTVDFLKRLPKCEAHLHIGRLGELHSVLSEFKHC